MTRISRPVLFVMSVAFVAGYLAVSLWGWGGLRGFFAEPARAAVCAGLLGLAVVTPACGLNLSIGRRDDASNNWIFVPLLLCGTLLGWVSAYSDRHGFWTIRGDAVRSLGVGVFTIGVVLRVASMLTLGRRFSVWVAVQDGHALVTNGLYRAVRHPSYTGALLALFGWALAFRSTLGVLVAALMIPPLLTRMTAEETMLVSEFGEEYEEYQARTWRLVPYLY